MSDSLISMSRRELMATTAALGSAALLTDSTQVSADEEPRSIPVPESIVDTNVSVFKWPFRQLPLDETKLLVDKLKHLGISTAWAGSFEGILHRDMSAVNQRLADECKQHTELVPVGTINPSLPGWKTDFQKCCDNHQMPGVRVYPNYHQYTLEHPAFTELLRMAHDEKRFVQIVSALEDTRTQHELVHVPDVVLDPLIEILKRPEMPKVQILNARLRTPQLQKMATLENLYLDTTRVDGTDGLTNLLDVFPAHRICFGTHAPFLIPEAALIRMIESPLADDQRRMLISQNSRSLLGEES